MSVYHAVQYQQQLSFNAQSCQRLPLSHAWKLYQTSNLMTAYRGITFLPAGT